MIFSMFLIGCYYHYSRGNYWIWVSVDAATRSQLMVRLGSSSGGLTAGSASSG